MSWLGSDRAYIRQALLRQLHAGSDVAGFANVEIEREYGLRTALLDPADEPAKRGLAAFCAEQAGLGTDRGLACGGDRKDVANQFLGPLRDRQRAAAQP